MVLSGVYTITNLSNNKMYVGCATSIEVRLKKHRKVLQLDLEGNLIKEWDSMVEAVNFTNISYDCIIRHCRGRIKQIQKSTKFLWKYKEE